MDKHWVSSMGAHASLVPASLDQHKADDGLKRVQLVMMQQLPPPGHTGILSTSIRMQVRESLLSLGLRRDVLTFLLAFCTPAEVGHLAGVDRGTYECCEADAVWDRMLAADFWMSPAPYIAGPEQIAKPVFDGFISRHISRLNSEILGKTRAASSASSKQLLIHRWRGEVDLRKKQALRQQIQQLQAEQEVRLVECRQRWNAVIRRRRAVALTVWMTLLLCCLRWSLMSWWVLAIRFMARMSYKLLYNLAWTLLQLAPGALVEGLCILLTAQRNRKRRRRQTHDSSSCSSLRLPLLCFRRAFLLCSCLYISVFRQDYAWAKRFQHIVGVICMLLAGWGAFAAAVISATIMLGLFVLAAYSSLFRARCFMREFAAVAQRDRQEVCIAEEYQGRMRKCRIALGLPPEDRKPSCNCRVL